jgi:hypothetical protein
VRSRARLCRALRSGQLNRPRHRARAVDEELVAAEAAIAVTAIRVEDSEARSLPRRAGPVATDHDLQLLADDVPAEVDPRSTRELQTDARPLAHGGGEIREEPGRLEEDDGDAGATSQRSQPAEPIRHGGRAIDARGQIDHEDIDGSARQERAGDRDPFVRGFGRDDDEPFRLDPASHGLDRIERGGEVQPGDDGAGFLRGGREPQRERGSAAGQLASQRHAHPARHTTGTEDGIELREAGGMDLGGIGLCERATVELRGVILERNRRERPHHLAEPRRRCGPPLRAESREGCRHVRSQRRHRPSIEHLFE